MTENFEIKGQWFLPDNPKSRVSGTLFYDTNKGFYLELFGDFNESQIIPVSDILEFDFILGLTSDSKEITLYKSFITKRSGIRLVQNQEAGIPFSIFSVNYVFEGAHFSNESELNFDRLTTEIIDFDEWVAISGFKNDFDIEKRLDLRRKNEFECKYKLPDTITFNLSDQLEGRFEFSLSNSDHFVYTKKVTLEQKIKFSLNYKTEQKYNVLLTDLFKFQSFLMLALYEKTLPYNIILSNNKLTKDYGPAGVVKRQIKLFIHSSLEFKSLSKQKHFMDMLFSYRDIEEDFPDIISKWYKKYDDLESSFNLLIEQFFNDKRFSENTFLNLAQCIESFHAHTRNKPKIPKDEYNDMKKHILSTVDSKYHSWLKDQFNFGNNLNLHARLEEIIDFCSCDMISQLISDKNSFIKDVKNSRNYYTHYSNDLKKKALKGTDLFYLSQKLKIIIVCSFLLEIGFDKTKLNQLLEDKKYKFFYGLLKL